MGLFSRSRTTTTTKTASVLETKIIKLSYLQTLAISGGLTNAKDLAGETAARTNTISSNSASASDIKEFGREYGSLLRGRGAVGGFIGEALGILPIGTGGVTSWLLGGALNSAASLFVRSRSTQQSIKTVDSGWSVIKTWNQPQFDIIRYAIGIKELNITQFTYEPVSETISKPWTSPKEIIKVVVYVDQFIPSSFPSGGSYIEYYVRPDIEGIDWIRINGIGLPTVFNSDGTIVPRVVSFNVERPVSSIVEQAYITTPKPVTSIRFKAILRRPDTLESGEVADSYSPILKSYKLIMTPRGGL